MTRGVLLELKAFSMLKTACRACNGALRAGHTRTAPASCSATLLLLQPQKCILPNSDSMWPML